MLVSVAMTALCVAAVAFYMRFLLALFKEYRPHSTGYWLRLRVSSSEGTVVEMQQWTKPVTRAA
jgi:hypothetical protein